jgi:hypothetical protein
MKRNGWLWTLLLLPLMSGCNNTDDVKKIFTQKNWKLSVIIYDSGSKTEQCKDYWSSDKEFNTSNELVTKSGTFTLRFEGNLVEGDMISGNVTGKAAGTDIQTTWSANGNTRKFSTGVKATTDTDILGTVFLRALSNATAYSGDENNLYIYFKEGQSKRFMLFRVVE